MSQALIPIRPVRVARRDRRARARPVLVATAVTLAAGGLAHPAGAVPVGEPFEVAEGASATAVSFDPEARQYLLAGGFGLVSVAASGDPDLRPAGGLPNGARGGSFASDLPPGPKLLVYIDRRSEERGLKAVLLGPAGAAHGPPVLVERDANSPAVAYNTRRDEYLVVYAITPGYEGYGGPGLAGRRLGGDGKLRGAAFPVTDYRAAGGKQGPELAYRAATDDYVLAWTEDDGRLNTNVHARRLESTGLPGEGPVQLSPEPGGINTRAGVPSLAAPPESADALVTWASRDGVVATRLRGRRLVPGPLLPVAPRGGLPKVAYSPSAREYLVVWSAVDPGGPLGWPHPRYPVPRDTFAVFGQHLTRSGREIGPDDFGVSERRFSEDGSWAYSQHAPSIAADPGSPGYLVAWNTDTYAPVTIGRVALARRVTTARGGPLRRGH